MPSVFTSSSATILVCGDSHAMLGCLTRASGRIRLVRHQVEPLGQAGGKDAWLEGTLAALRRLGRPQARVGAAVLVLPAHRVLTKMCRIPRMDGLRMQKLMRFEAEQQIPGGLSAVSWDSVIARESNSGLEVMLAAAKGGVVDALVEAAQSAGFRIRMVLPSVLALLAAARVAAPAAKAPILVLDLGDRATTLLRVSPEGFAARTMLADGGRTAPGLAIESLVTRLAMEVARSLVHFDGLSGNLPPQAVLLTGRLSGQTGLCEALAGRLKLPVSLLDLGTELHPVQTEAGAADLFGAAAAVLLPGQATVNLLPLPLRRQERSRKRAHWLTAAAFLALAAVLPPLVHYREAAATARVRLVEMESALAPLRIRDVRNRENLARLAGLRRQVAGLQSIVVRRTAWLQLLADLQERLTAVEDVWLDQMRTIPPSGDIPMKLAISGRMIDKTNPLAKVSPETFVRVKALLAGIVDSPFVVAVEAERFDNNQPGLLRFDFVLVTDPAHPL